MADRFRNVKFTLSPIMVTVRVSRSTVISDLIVTRTVSAIAELLVVTNGGVKSAQTPPCDILFFSVCLESPENQVTQTPFRIKRKI